MIPKIIHQTWKTDEIPEKWIHFVNRVQELNPDWQYKLWTDDNNDAFVKSEYPEFFDIFKGFSRNIMRADVIRYLIMYKIGGVYLDLDYEVLKPFDFKDHKIVLPLNRSVEYGDKKNALGNCIFASVPGHAFWKDVINDLSKNPPIVTDYSQIVDSTGPGLLTRIYNENYYQDIHLPERLIYHPPSPKRKKDADKLRNNNVSLGIHHPWGSWKVRWTSTYIKNKIQKNFKKWIISKLVVVKKGKIMGLMPKQNGHPVPSIDIGFSCEEKPYNQEACDVRTHYSTLFPLSSNQNCQTDRYARSGSCEYPTTTQQTLCSDLPALRSTSHWRSQLGRTKNTRSEPCYKPSVAYMPISKSVLRTLPRHPRRGFGTFSSLSTGYTTNGPICIRALSIHDRIGSRQTFRSELENGQIHRQILSGTRVWSTQSNRVTDSCRGRNIHTQGPSIFNHRTGLSHRSSRLCRQGSQGRDTRTFFQSIGCRTTQ
jgi:mannosyltransferase OCH1-like enzyme